MMMMLIMVLQGDVVVVQSEDCLYQKKCVGGEGVVE